ncbi:MAG TPA: hypothetical protein VFE59_21825 [Trebonia sp.]|nr:hypothetical protein [Trebonia sp.]
MAASPVYTARTARSSSPGTPTAGGQIMTALGTDAPNVAGLV